MPAIPALTSLIDFSGRAAIVTGGAMGIGRAVAERLHEAGAAVLIADPSPPRPSRPHGRGALRPSPPTSPTSRRSRRWPARARSASAGSTCS